MSTLSSNPAMGSFDCFGFGNGGTVIPPGGEKKEAENSTKGSSYKEGLAAGSTHSAKGKGSGEGHMDVFTGWNRAILFIKLRFNCVHRNMQLNLIEQAMEVNV